MGEIACSCNFERAGGLVAISVVAGKKATKTWNYLAKIIVAAIH
jgi:hypothetical protein